MMMEPYALLAALLRKEADGISAGLWGRMLEAFRLAWAIESSISGEGDLIGSRSWASFITSSGANFFSV